MPFDIVRTGLLLILIAVGALTAIHLYLIYLIVITSRFERRVRDSIEDAIETQNAYMLSKLLENLDEAHDNYVSPLPVPVQIGIVLAVAGILLLTDLAAATVVLTYSVSTVAVFLLIVVPQDLYHVWTEYNFGTGKRTPIHRFLYSYILLKYWKWFYPDRHRAATTHASISPYYFQGWKHNNFVEPDDDEPEGDAGPGTDT